MANSPWGRVQSSQIFARGFRFVSTAGHGGYMLTKKFASENLSKEAQRRGVDWANYLCYEEDCQVAIVDWELPQYWEKSLSMRQRRLGPMFASTC